MRLEGVEMLIEFRVANFRSFNEEQTLSLVASSDPTRQDNLIPGDKFRLVRTAALYGANASGKSNLIKAFRILKSFVLDSATKMNQGDEIPGIAPFVFDPASREMPSRFEVIIAIGKIRYQYGFSATTQSVHDEWLFAYSQDGRKQRWIERQRNPHTKAVAWHFRGPLQKAGQMLRDTTRENGLALSRGANLNIEPLKELFLWFRTNLWVFDLSMPPDSLIMQTAQRIKADPRFRERVLRMVHDADTGIDGLSVSEEQVPWEALPEEVRAYLVSRKAKSGDRDLSTISVRTKHRPPGWETEQEFDMGEQESHGTQRLFALAGPFLDALDRGTAVVVDELDCSIHPLLTRKLIELFQSPQTLDKGAQLIFATHDTTLMAPGLFRRDQLWLVEKDRRDASELVSLYDFDAKGRPRNTEAFQRGYLAGRYGGIPNFGPTFEDLEIR